MFCLCCPITPRFFPSLSRRDAGLADRAVSTCSMRVLGACASSSTRARRPTSCISASSCACSRVLALSQALWRSDAHKRNLVHFRNKHTKRLRHVWSAERPGWRRCARPFAQSSREKQAVCRGGKRSSSFGLSSQTKANDSGVLKAIEYVTMIIRSV